MKQLVIFLFALVNIVYGQSKPTTAKTLFVNGLFVGTKPNSYFKFADSNAVYWSPDSLLMAKYKGAPKKILFYNDSLVLNITSTNKTYNGGADTLFSGDPYYGPINTTKTGFIHHYYGISDNQNGGGDITYFKENGINYKRIPNIADRRVLPNREIWYHQYSANNGMDSIYSRRSIAAVVAARVSSNSTLGDMRGWYEIVTAKDSGYKTMPTSKDFVVSEGKIGVNVPNVLNTNDLTSTANVYGDLYVENGVISNKLTLRNSPALTNWETYVSGTVLAKKVVGSAFDNFQLRNGGARPLLVRSSLSNPPVYLYNDGSGGGVTISETQLTGYYQTLTSGFFNIADVEIFRFNNVGGPRFGVNTGNTLSSTFHVRGSISSTAALLVSNNLNSDLFRVNNSGAVIATNNIQAPKLIGNSLVPTILMAGNFTTGIGATASIIGNDIAGEITFNTTTGISTSGTIFTFTYSSPYPSAPIILFTPASQTLTTGANPIISRLFVSSVDIGQFQVSVSAGTLLTESTTFKLNYHILGK